jgi:nucleoid DNA-binding protein
MGKRGKDRPKPPGAPPTHINTRALARELHLLLGIPQTLKRDRSGNTYRSPLKGQEIIRTVLKVIADALRRGESVEVRGFGKFVIRTRPATTKRYTILGKNPKSNQLDFAPGIHRVPARKYVWFIPAASLTAWLNLQAGTPLNAFQQRAVKYWHLA